VVSGLWLIQIGVADFQDFADQRITVSGGPKSPMAQQRITRAHAAAVNNISRARLMQRRNPADRKSSPSYMPGISAVFNQTTSAHPQLTALRLCHQSTLAATSYIQFCGGV